MKRTKLLIGLLTAALFAIPLLAAAHQPIVIKFSHVVAVDTPKGKAAELFAKRQRVDPRRGQSRGLSQLDAVQGANEPLRTPADFRGLKMRILMPAMVKAGFPNRFGAGVITTSGALGILIPPSIGMVMYAVATNASIGALFMAGVLPGLVRAVILRLVTWYRAWCFGYPRVMLFPERTGL